MSKKKNERKIIQDGSPKQMGKRKNYFLSTNVKIRFTLRIGFFFLKRYSISIKKMVEVQLKMGEKIK